MNSRSPRFETVAYLLAFLLACALRFARLGVIPLTDSEATLALQALQLVQGLKPALGSHVAYVNLTAILFYIFGSTNFLARFWPALAGTVLVFVPYLFRDQIKARPAMLLAFFLAVDPAFVSISRTAGSSIFAVVGVLFAWGFWQRGQSRLAGVFAALALLGGPSLWAGLLGLLLTWLIAQWVAARPKSEEMEHVNTYTGTQVNTSEQDVTPNPQPATSSTQYATYHPVAERSGRNTQHGSLTTDYRSLITASLLTLFLISTLFLLAPQGLSAWLASLPAYLLGWVSPSSVPTSRMLLALAVYQPLAILLAVIAILRGWIGGSRKIIRLSLWMLVALLLAVFYPTRTPADLVWALIPLWTMAAIELTRHIQFAREDRLETASVIIFTIILLGFAWMDLSALYWTPIPSAEGNLRLTLLLGSVLLFIVSVVLVGYGWSERIARVGAAAGVTFILGLYTLGAAYGATGLRVPNSMELWQTDATIAQADLLTQTADQISDWSTGHADSLTVTVYGVDSPALLWALRFYNPQVVTALDPTSSPDLVVTFPQQDLQLAAAYRGQDFVWRQVPAWDVFSAYSLRWLTLREMPLQPENIVLWARDDLFIDSQP
jgi:hypothetical protein